MSNSECVKRIERDQVSRIDASGVFAQRHVAPGSSSHFASRSSGKRGEVLGEMLDRQPRAVGLRVDGRLGDRQDARALAPAHDAVVVLALPKRGRSLEIDDRVQPLLGQLVALVQPGAQLAARPRTPGPARPRS